MVGWHFAFLTRYGKSHDDYLMWDPQTRTECGSKAIAVPRRGTFIPRIASLVAKQR